MFIKRLGKHHFDVFLGNGWGHWTRVRKNHWGISVVDGFRLPRATLNQVKVKLGIN